MSQFEAPLGTSDPYVTALSRHMRIATDFPEQGSEGFVLVSQGPDVAAKFLPTGSAPPTVHVLATTAGLGPQHTVSGLTAGQVLRATAANAAAFQVLQASDLPAHTHDASQIVSGVFARAQLPTQVAYEDEVNTFTLTQAFNAAAPFTVASAALITNLNADRLDSQDGSFYLDLANATGVVARARLPAQIAYEDEVNTFTLANAFGALVTFSGGKILVDGIDSVIAAGEVGLAENGGNLRLGTRASMVFDIDNDNNATGMSWTWSQHALASTIMSLTDDGSLNLMGLFKTAPIGTGFYVTFTGDSGTADRGGRLMSNTTGAGAGFRRWKETSTFNGAPGTASRYRAGWVDDADLETFLNAGAAIEVGPSNDIKLNLAGTGAVIIGVDPGGTDLLRVGGSMRGTKLGLGGPATADRMVQLAGAAGQTTGASQYGIVISSGQVFNSSATSDIIGIHVGPTSENAVFTTSNVRLLNVNGINKGASHTITTLVGIEVGPMTQGATNFSIRTSTGRVRFGDDLELAARLLFTTAAAKIIPGATNISLRNSADTADNLLLTESGTATFRNNLNVFMPTNALMQFSGAAANTRDIVWQTAGVNRWIWRANATPETGADVGTDFQLLARHDDGTLLDSPVLITRAAGGTISLNRPVSLSGALTLPTGPLIIGTDPGGAALLRVGSGAAFTQEVAWWSSSLRRWGIALSGAGGLQIKPTVDAASTFLYVLDNAATVKASIDAATGNAIFGPSITATTTAGVVNISVQRPAGFTGGYNFNTAGIGRWGIYVTEVPEGGADSGSNFRIRARSDAGAFLDDPITIVRAATGAIALGNIGNRPVVVGADPGGIALLRVGGDLKLASLGVFDSTDVPAESEILMYHAGATNKWQAESLQLIYNAGDAAVALLADNTSTQFLYYDPGVGADSPVGAPPAPVLKLFPLHKGVTVVAHASTGPDVYYHDGPSYPADFRHFLFEYSTDNFATAAKPLATASSDKVNHGRLTIGTTYYYRARAVDRAGNASANSAVVSFVAVASSDTSNFGVVLANEIAVDRLGALSANIGIITAGQMRNIGNTAGINFGGAGGIPGSWVAGINFEVGAGVGAMTRYLNWTATGNNPVFRFDNALYLNADGTAKFGGQVDITDAQITYNLQSMHIALHAPGVAHGMTSLVPTDVHGAIGYTNPNDGGLSLIGFTEQDRGIDLQAYVTNLSSVTRAAMYFSVGKKSGTTAAAIGASEIGWRWSNWGSMAAQMTGDGTLTLGATVNSGGLDRTRFPFGYGSVSSSADLVIAGGGSSPNKASIAWGDNSGWTLQLGTNVGSVFAPRFTFLDTGNMIVGTTGGDIAIGPISSKLRIERASAEQLTLYGESNAYAILQAGRVYVGPIIGAPGTNLQVQGNMSLTDNVASGNPYILWSWYNAAAAYRTGYLECAGDTMRIYSSSFGAVLMSWDFATGAVSAPAGPLLFANGTVAAPSIAFLSEPNLGFYRHAAGFIGVGVGAATVAQFDAGGLLTRVGTSATLGRPVMVLGAVGSVDTTATVFTTVASFQIGNGLFSKDGEWVAMEAAGQCIAQQGQVQVLFDGLVILTSGAIAINGNWRITYQIGRGQGSHFASVLIQTGVTTLTAQQITYAQLGFTESASHTILLQVKENAAGGTNRLYYCYANFGTP